MKLLVGGLLAVAVGYSLVLIGAAGSPLGPWALAVGTAVVLSALLALAARRAGAIPRSLRATSALVFVATAGGLLYALAASAPVSDGPLLLGLPRVTAVLLLVVGLVPLIVLPVAYACAFKRDVLSEDDIARVTAAANRAANAAANTAANAAMNAARSPRGDA